MGRASRKRAQARQAARQSARTVPWEPGTPEPVQLPPWSEWVRSQTYFGPDGQERQCPDDELVFANARYQVSIRQVAPAKPFGRILWLSIKLRSRAPMRRWRDLQRIKNELVGPSFEAVEIFPAEERLVDTSNQYHLWVFIDGYRLPFGYAERLVVGISCGGAVQAPFEPDERAEYSRCVARDPSFAESSRFAMHASRPDGETCMGCTALGFACSECLGAADVEVPLEPGDCGGCGTCPLCMRLA